MLFCSPSPVDCCTWLMAPARSASAAPKIKEDTESDQSQNRDATANIYTRLTPCSNWRPDNIDARCRTSHSMNVEYLHSNVSAHPPNGSRGPCVWLLAARIWPSTIVT